MSKPLISFIIPALNEQHDLAETIKPLKSLNWLAKEIIVADGGSTDKTVKIAKQYADKVFERNNKNKSIAETRNNGAKLASGKYLFFMDSGVRIKQLNEFVKKVLSIMENSAKTVGITSEVRFYPEEENKVDKMGLWVINKTMRGMNKMGTGVAFGWVQVVKHEAFKKIGGYKEDLIVSEDHDLFRRLSRIGKTICLKDFVAYNTAVRFHQVGWPKMVGRWTLDFLSYFLRGKSYTKEWKRVYKERA